MLFTEFVSHIALPDEAIQALCLFSLSESEYRRYHHLFYKNRELFFQEIEAREDHAQLFFYLYVHFFYKQYCRLDGEEANVLLCGAQDITLWVRKYHHHYHVWGMMPYMWRFIDRILNGNIVRLDCLEFEVKGVTKDICCEEIYLHHEQSLIINIHVPEQSALDIVRCENAIQKAVEYFKHIPPIFYCDSWLLAPVLRKLLPEDSRIIQFQKLFTIIDVDENNQLMEERIFDDILSNPKDYEEDTTLQREAKQHVMCGGKLGTGVGLITKHYFALHGVSHVENHKDMLE